MRKLYFVTLCVFFLTNFFPADILREPVHAQVNQEWIRSYNGAGNAVDAGSAIGLDVIGNVYVAGTIRGLTSFDDYCLMKYNSSGQLQWIQRYNGLANGNDVLTSMAVDGSGNVYATGRSAGAGTSYDLVTVKYDASGVFQWVHRYNGPGNGEDGGNVIMIAPSGSIYAGGYSEGTPGNARDFTVVKYGANGSVEWVQRYNGPGYGPDEVNALAFGASGITYAAGRSYGNGTNYDYCLIRLNSTGNIEWIQRYDYSAHNFDEAYAVAVDNLGNIYECGKSFSSNFDYCILKYNSSGSLQWAQRYAGSGEDIAYSMKIDGSNNLYVAGSSMSLTAMLDFLTIKLSSSGSVQWINRYNGPGNGDDAAFALELDNAGNVYVTGYSTGNGTAHDYTTVKYNPSGGQQWVQRYNGFANGNDASRSITVNAFGNVYITGGSAETGTGTDITTIAYSQPVGVVNGTGEVPTEFKLLQNYPNPFNAETVIRFDVPSIVKGQTSNVRLIIHDILGHGVAILVNERLNPGKYEVEWNATNYPSGIYYYELNAGDYRETKKMVLIK